MHLWLVSRRCVEQKTISVDLTKQGAKGTTLLSRLAGGWFAYAGA